jgi:WS/DGAT/MGAT family acyltransferase
MKQLSGIDTAFLQLERGNNYMHVGSLGIYDPSTAPEGKVRFKDILRFFTARLDAFPHFRRQLVSVPLGLDRPYWIMGGEIDVEFHVRHIALPQPGDWRQLCIQVARIHSRPLDRSKPLWEAYVIEGLHNVTGVPPGSFALYLKIHHSLIDGEAGSQIMHAIHAMSPDEIDEEVETDVVTRYADRAPTPIELYSRALLNQAQNVPDLAKFSLETATRVASLGAGYVSRLARERNLDSTALAALKSGDLSSLMPVKLPDTRFAGNVSAHRVFEAVGFPLDQMKTIRQQIGDVTINDLFMTMVGGTLNRYLGSKNELPADSIMSMVPMTLRGTDKSEEGNQVGFTMMPVHSEIDDPIERLEAIRADSNKAKEVTGQLGKGLAKDLLGNLPAAVANVLLRSVKLPKMSLIVSNVRGSDVPLYMAGARLVSFAPISIAVDGTGLNVTGFSYAGTMWICAVSCREMLPDPAFFAQCMRESFAELVNAAAACAAQRAAEHELGHAETAEPVHVEPELPTQPKSRRARKPVARKRKGRARAKRNRAAAAE